MTSETRSRSGSLARQRPCSPARAGTAAPCRQSGCERCASNGALQLDRRHQPRHRATGSRDPFAAEPPPELADPARAGVRLDNAADLARERGIAACPAGSLAGSRRRARCAGSVDGAVGRILPIGSTPDATRWASMTAITAWTGGRAPPGRKSARLLRDRVRPPQLADLALERLDAVPLFAPQAGTPPSVPFPLPHPVPQHLGATADLLSVSVYRG